LLLALALFCLADGALLWSLSRLRLSFASDAETLLPFLASVLVRLLTLWGLAAARLAARIRPLTASKGRKRRAQRDKSLAGLHPTALLFLAIHVAFSIVQVDAYILEPQWVQTTELSFTSERLDASVPPVRIVHLADLHIERKSYREAKIVRKVNALAPDIIVLTGDYLNLSRLHDPTSAAHFRKFVSQLSAPYGIYAVRGTVEPSKESMEWLMQGTDVTWLEQSAHTLEVRGQQVTLVGVACSHDLEQDIARLDEALTDRPEDTLAILLYHSPDLIGEVAERDLDLYLSGHTHGGQLRLPFLGPIVTASAYGRQYVAGLFEAPSSPVATGRSESTWMHNSRGLGLEGGSMPRARFLCRPEIVSIDLAGR
jgi:predicted MPP superfamily phosphohydrolase